MLTPRHGIGRPPRHHRAPLRAAAQRGLSLVELLVGVAIGLFIVAAAALMVGNQLTDNRRLLLETQLQQDMRATLDIMSRQIRRAGALSSGNSQNVVASDSGAFGTTNPTLEAIDQSALGADDITFRYYLNLETQIFEYQLVGGVLKARIGGLGSLQDLTDPNVMKVTSLVIGAPTGETRSERTSEPIPCPKLCSDGTRSCWPTVKVRNYRIVLEAESARDSAVRRRMVGEVRVRNDRIDNPWSMATWCPA